MMVFRKVFVGAAALLWAAAWIGAASAEATLQVIRFPERRDVEVNMLPSPQIPGAKMKAKVKVEEGQSRIEISYDNMKPAVLFAGDITCYVLWAVNRDGAAENLGELWVRPERDKDELKFSTGLRSFALMVTAEPYYQASRPSDFVIFRNDGRPDPPVQTDSVVFDSFDPASKRGLDTLANVRYDGKTPLDLLQAEKVYEIAGRLGADQYAPEVYREANIGLRQARQVVQTRAQKGAQDYARRSVASSNEAIKITLRKLEAEKLEKLIAARQSEMASLQSQAAAAEAQAKAAEQRAAEIERQKEAAERSVQQANAELQRIASDKQSLESTLSGLRSQQADLRNTMQQLEGQLTSLREEKARLEDEKQRLREDKAQVEDRLQGALSLVAETRESARGLILNLGDILFDTGQATLKPDARLSLAKLAGILLILPELNLRIEGHTDSTGSASFNLQLSERRANSVLDFLADQGVASTRMIAAGYGQDRPIADNSTAAGRTQNRRVEIVIAEGTVAEESR